jgi:hypothetical protein
MEKSLYYKPSNKFSILSFLGLFLGSALAGIILSIPYLWGVRMIPYTKITILLAVLLGGVLGWIGNLLIGAFKVRNRPLAILAVLLGILVYTYFKWSSYVSFQYSESSSYIELLLPLMLNPVALWDGIMEINKLGTWSLNDNNETVKGIMLTLVWAGEFLIIAGIQIGLMLERPTEPFIESENKWAVKNEAVVCMRHFSPKEMKTAIEQDPSVMLQYVDVPAVVSSINHVRIDHYHSSDYSENYITVKEIEIKNGKPNEYKVIKKLAVSRAFISDLYAKAGVSFAQ